MKIRINDWTYTAVNLISLSRFKEISLKHHTRVQWYSQYQSSALLLTLLHTNFFFSPEISLRGIFENRKKVFEWKIYYLEISFARVRAKRCLTANMLPRELRRILETFTDSQSALDPDLTIRIRSTIEEAWLYVSFLFFFFHVKFP